MLNFFACLLIGNFGIVVAEALACGLPVVIAEPVNIAADVAASDAGVHFDTVKVPLLPYAVGFKCRQLNV